jgi:hypothetical protein
LLCITQRLHSASTATTAAKFWPRSGRHVLDFKGCRAKTRTTEETGRTSFEDLMQHPDIAAAMQQGRVMAGERKGEQ